MSECKVPRCRWLRRVAVLAVLIGVPIAGMGIATRARAQAWIKAADSPDRGRRLRALQNIGREREAAATEVVRRILGREPDREILEAAGYAAFRVLDLEALSLLRQRADSGPDDYARAKLIIYTCRLSRRDWRLLDWLLAGAHSAEPWRHAGGCIGLLELGRPEGGVLLLQDVKTLPADVQALALSEFRRLAEPLFQAVGQPVAWPANEAIPPAAWDALAAAWTRCATPELLADVLERVEGADAQWHEVNRLLHARKRVAKWLS